MVIKKDGSRVTFDNEKILRGIQAACGKRPVSEEQKLQIVREVEETVYRAHEREVDSIEIGHHVARLLRNTDQIAFVRYASEYQSFDSLEDVEQTIRELRDMPPSVEGQSELFPSE
jgi:transcriptional repressor NrdR